MGVNVTVSLDCAPKNMLNGKSSKNITRIWGPLVVWKMGPKKFQNHTMQITIIKV